MPVENYVGFRVTPTDAKDLPNDPGHPSVRMLSHGSMEVRWFRPETHTQHQPHDRDELYFVVSGSALFKLGGDGHPFDEKAVDIHGPQIVNVSPGDILFVPAGACHDFDATSSDFAVWAVFYGPEGGEAA